MDLIDRKLFRRNNRDVFLLVLEWNSDTRQLTVKGSVPDTVLAKIHIDYSELLGDAPVFSYDKTASFLEHVAHELFRMPNAKLYCFDKSLLDKKGKVLTDKLQEYRDGLKVLNEQNPEYVSYSNNKALCIYFKQLYARAQYETESFKISYIRRKTFEELLSNQEQINDYVNCYTGLRFIKVISYCKEASFTCAVLRKEIVMVYVDYGKLLRW